MELWIRSQDKEKLIKSKNIKYGFGIYGHIILNEEIILGKYETKERALEVLDEIQKLITPQIIMREMKSTGLIENGMSDGTLYIKNEPIVQIIDPIVYEMPKE